MFPPHFSPNRPTSPIEKPLVWDVKYFKALFTQLRMHLLFGIYPFVVRTQATSLEYCQSPNTLPIIPPKTNNFFCDKVSKKKIIYSICASKILPLWVKETTYWATLAEVWSVDQGNTLSFLTHHWGGHTWNTAFSARRCCWRGSCEDNKARLFLLVATRGNSHKLWLEMFRLYFRKISSPWGWCNVGVVCRMVVRSQFLYVFHHSHFHQFPWWQKSHGLCSTHTWDTAVTVVSHYLEVQPFFSCSRGKRDIICCFLSICPGCSLMGPVLS